jgi:hypothetical protein
MPLYLSLVPTSQITLICVLEPLSYALKPTLKGTNADEDRIHVPSLFLL